MSEQVFRIVNVGAVITEATEEERNERMFAAGFFRDLLNKYCSPRVREIQ
jgi:hypothetical protein